MNKWLIKDHFAGGKSNNRGTKVDDEGEFVHNSNDEGTSRENSSIGFNTPYDRLRTNFNGFDQGSRYELPQGERKLAGCS